MGQSVTTRPTQWWLRTLKKRKERMSYEQLDLSRPIEWNSIRERQAAVSFFNAAFRAEESGLRQAHELADEVGQWDPDLAEVLCLYGNEEGWHRELLEEFLAAIGGEVQPMGKVTRTFYRVYARAKRMETIVLTNLMFETIGATTYRLALGRVKHPAARQMLTILTRDESFHVPLNVHFLKKILERRTPQERMRLRLVYYLLFASLVALPIASRPKAQAFDSITVRELSRAYAEQLARLFAHEPELGLAPPRALLSLLGISKADLAEPPLAASSVEAAEAAADRAQVEVQAL